VSVWLSTKTRIAVERRVNEADLLLLIRFVVVMCDTKYEMWCPYWRFLTSGLPTAPGPCDSFCLSTDQTFPTHPVLLVIYNITCTSVVFCFTLVY
jgi:hypothetical protein